MGYEEEEAARGEYNCEVAREAFDNGDFDDEIRRLILEGKFDEEVKERAKALKFVSLVP